MRGYRGLHWREQGTASRRTAFHLNIDGVVTTDAAISVYGEASYLRRPRGPIAIWLRLRIRAFPAPRLFAQGVVNIWGEGAARRTPAQASRCRDLPGYGAAAYEGTN